MRRKDREVADPVKIADIINRCNCCIIGNGIMSMVSATEEKKLGLSLLMEHNTGKREWNFDEKKVNA